MVRKLAFLLFALFPAWHVHAEVIDIDNAEIARLIAAGVPVIDIRTQGEWQESGVVAGSRLLTLFDENGRADPSAWLQQVRGVAKPNQPVILICRSGNRTRKASQILSQQGGYQTVYNSKDGIRAWAREGLPLTPAPKAMANCPAGKTC